VKSARLAAASFLVAGLLGIAGCGGSHRLAPVSGVVTLDGKPYDNAVVVFQPVASKGNINPGLGSSAHTDRNGRFVLKSMDGKNNGAIIGKHMVRISTRGNDVVGEDLGTGSPDGVLAAPSKKIVNAIPPEWNSESNKEFEVPAGGTDKANFDIISAKGGKK